MRQQHRMLLILATSTALAGCVRGAHATTVVEKHLKVAGTQQGVERFAKLQGALRPALAMSAIKLLGNGRAEATVTIPASYNGVDVGHTTREALAADLDYSFEERRSVVRS